MATHSSILAWTIPWTEEPGRLQSMGSQRVRHNWSNLSHTQMHIDTDIWNLTSLHFRYKHWGPSHHGFSPVVVTSSLSLRFHPSSHHLVSDLQREISKTCMWSLPLLTPLSPHPSGFPPHLRGMLNPLQPQLFPSTLYTRSQNYNCMLANLLTMHILYFS